MSRQESQESRRKIMVKGTYKRVIYDTDLREA